MCGPLAPIVMGVASAGLGAVQTVAAYQGQKQAAEATRQSALLANEQSNAEITRRQVQEDGAVAQKIALQNIEEAQLASNAEVSAASAGVSGVSVDNLLADVARGAATNRETIRENARMTASQLQLEKKGVATTAQSRINSAPQPSGLSLVAGLGSSALSGYSAYKRRMD